MFDSNDLICKYYLHFLSKESIINMFNELSPSPYLPTLGIFTLFTNPDMAKF